MAKKNNEPSYPYQPQYAIPPGWLLESHLEAREMSQAECARRCGRSPKLMSEIISGKAPIEPDTALQLEKVLGLHSAIWIGAEKDYRLHLAREAQAQRAAAAEEWLKSFPVAALVKRGVLTARSSVAERVDRLLAFFGVASVDAWQERQGSIRVAFRQSPSFSSEDTALATWLRFGEIEADGVECADYDVRGFKEALRCVRGLTQKPIDEAWGGAMARCRETGVALVYTKLLPKASVSGAARWVTPRKALIQLSARHKTDDHLWFSFFHEAAHLLLHTKKDVFVDGFQGEAVTEETKRIEAEANEWAANWLVPAARWKRFVEAKPGSAEAVREFAEEQGIGPGIVVGRLQRERVLDWSHLNRLKKAGIPPCH